MAKIVGNIVGLPNPQPDWNQTDEKRADYIKNKPAITDVVRKTGDEQIQGIKDFINGLKTAKITSDGRIAIEATDAPVTIYANGEYLFYDNTIYINGKNILTDSPKYDSVSAEQITTKKIQGDAEGDYFEIQADGMNINSGSGVNISASTGININTHESPFLVNGKAIATEEYVNEAIKDVDGGSITIDNVPTEGSANAVSSGGVYVVIKTQEQEVRRIASSLNDVQADISSLITNKAEKSYVDSSIQQAILDSWAEVVNP